jgi:hypothetical protein
VFPGHKGNGIEDACIIPLGEDARGDVIRGVCFNVHFSRGVKMLEDRGQSEGNLEGLECLLTGRGPFEYDTFLGEGDDGVN